MNAIIETIPHEDQRYSGTVGDWVIIADTIMIKVSDLGDEYRNILIGIHELIEAVLCKRRGITEAIVDEYDMSYDGPCEEPGADPNCPYFKEHIFATAVEKSLAQELEVDWDEYEKAIEELG
jgi:hypothetical protein